MNIDRFRFITDLRILKIQEVIVLCTTQILQFMIHISKVSTRGDLGEMEKRMQFLLFYAAMSIITKQERCIINAVAQPEQQVQQVCPVDATLHPQQQNPVSVSATTKADPRVVGHCGLPDKCR